MEGLNFRKVKRYLILIFFFSIFSTSSFSQDLKFNKIIKLNDPWGSSFINENEFIITEKSGKIKIVNINSQKISDWILFGIFSSLGFLSKYLFIYFLVSIFLFLIFIYKDHKKILFNYSISLLVSLIILTPHLIWLFDNEFVVC